MIERATSDGIRTLRLAHGKASALDLDLCAALQREFEEAAVSDDVQAVVLTGSGSIFSAGVDLVRLVDEGAAYVNRFLPMLETMLRSVFELPKPLVGAINGHAIAGGAILALSCDYRIMSGGRIGIPEILVGVPFPPLAFEIVRFAIPPQHLQPVIYLGTAVDAARAREMGLVDETVDAAALEARAGDVARQLASVSPTTFRETKRRMREAVVREGERVAADRGGEIARMWSAPDAIERVRAYVERTLRK